VVGNNYKKQANSANSLLYAAVEDSHLNKLTNRINTGLGITYDDAGNITSDSRFTGHQYLYDANNRQRQVAQPDGTGAVTSVYDGDALFDSLSTSSNRLRLADCVERKH
jgi:hypothetical protein